VAVTILASATLLPVLLGFAGRRVELTRWRGLVAASLVAVGMFSLGLKIVPLAALGILLALVVLVAGTCRVGAPSCLPTHVSMHGDAIFNQRGARVCATRFCSAQSAASACRDRRRRPVRVVGRWWRRACPGPDGELRRPGARAPPRRRSNGIRRRCG
jgi:hypothetical protein